MTSENFQILQISGFKTLKACLVKEIWRIPYLGGFAIANALLIKPELQMGQSPRAFLKTETWKFWRNQVFKKITQKDNSVAEI